MPYVLAIVFAVLTFLEVGSGPGAILAAVVGYTLGCVIQLRGGLRAVERRLESGPPPSSAPIAAEAAPVQPTAVEPGPAEPEPGMSAEPVAAAPPPTLHDQPARAPYQPSRIERVVLAAWHGVRSFFTTGNVVVRVGAVVLFFGIAFLLRYAYERELLPVELRLAGAALLGIALLALGWRLRHRSDTYGAVLQGAGVGILYLTIFGASRLYELVGITPAFVMMVVLVAGSSVLAVLQRAEALAIFAMSGGFLAPVLMSTGEGSHVALFSYYALLNGGILAMAWFRSWRWLNWIGFVFTFAIGATWGYRYYKPEFFASTEPFLLLFYFYYIGVSVLFSRRAAPNIGGLVDGTLIFGTPILAFALQAGLVHDMPFGLAYSAFGAALSYVALAYWLRGRSAFAGLLWRSFFALGVAFATLAIPFAFDDQRWTAAAWALEGAGLVWVGLRQAQRLPRIAGLLLQLGAGVAFIVEAFAARAEDVLFLNSAYFGTVMLSVAGGFSAFLISRKADAHRLERLVMWLLMAWSGLWWFAGGIREIGHYHPGWYGQFEANVVREHLFIVFAAISTAAVTFLATRLSWREARLLGFVLLPMVALLSGVMLIDWYGWHPLRDFGWVAWPLLFATLFYHLRTVDDIAASAVWHAATWWFAATVLAWIAAGSLDDALHDSAWQDCMWGLLPTLTIAVLLALRNRTQWPLDRFAASYLGWGVLPMAVVLGIWSLYGGFLWPADPAPLPYVVLLNPLELVQVAIVVVLIAWTTLSVHVHPSWVVPIRIAVGALAFVTLNTIAARAVHYYGGVPYPVEVVAESATYQATISILWTAIALCLMAVSAKRLNRPVWIAGAVLLGIVIVKLFTIDLANIDMVARIVSFITVGILMLVIGYLAPLPPAKAVESSS